MIIPLLPPEIDEWNMEHFNLRSQWQRKGMYAFVCKQWTTPLAKWIGNRRCLEVMAGAGWLSKALSEDNVNIVATDNDTWANKLSWEKVFEVTTEDCVDSVKRLGAHIDILIISWPYMDNNAYKAVKELYHVNPKALVLYIGEDYGGCTADDAFFLSFDRLHDTEFDKVARSFWSWPLIHDKPLIGRYSPKDDRYDEERGQGETVE